MNNGLVSVIMPVYNVEEYVEEAVDSVLSQSYKSVELLIYDDHSTDKTYSLIKRKYKDDNRVKLYKGEKNLGIVYALNYLLSKAKGAYIARADGDDILDKDRIYKQLKYLEKEKLDLVGCSLIGIDSVGNEINRNFYSDDQKKLLKIIKYSSPISHIWLAKKSVYDALNGYRLKGVEDYDFLLRMKTYGMSFGNVPNYYGMKIRKRDGNTVDLLGVGQRRLFLYARKLYRERLKGKADSYTEQKEYQLIIKNNIFNHIHDLSNYFLKKGVLKKSLFEKTPYYLLSLISPYQVHYLWGRYMQTIISK